MDNAGREAPGIYMFHDMDNVLSELQNNLNKFEQSQEDLYLGFGSDLQRPTNMRHAPLRVSSISAVCTRH